MSRRISIRPFPESGRRLYNLIQTSAQIGMNMVREQVTPRQFLAEVRRTRPRGRH